MRKQFRRSDVPSWDRDLKISKNCPSKVALELEPGRAFACWGQRELRQGRGNKLYTTADLQGIQVKLQTDQPENSNQEDMQGYEWRMSMDFNG